MIKLTDEMREFINHAFEDGRPCILATASPTGEPSLSFRGSMMVYDDEHLAYWERSKRAALEHIEANPKVVVMFRDPATRKGWRFFGEARVYREDPVRQEVMARVVPRELDTEAKRAGYAVVIRVDRVVILSGEVIQQRE
ncbi:MAG: pyridoxamine 5'-phosphate oxidase family protein [Dehalococcoidia bacterium]